MQIYRIVSYRIYILVSYHIVANQSDVIAQQLPTEQEIEGEKRFA